MTNNTTPIRKVTASEVIEFLTANEVVPQCLSCGNHGTLINIVDDDMQAAFNAMVSVAINKETGIAKLDASRGFVTITDECGRCGFIRHFSAKKIIQWLQENGSEKHG